jgi:internalin A
MMDKQELLRLIDQADDEGWILLDLSNRGLTELPPEIGKLASLKVLYLENNQLTSFPHEVGTLMKYYPIDVYDVKKLMTNYQCTLNTIGSIFTCERRM